MKKNIPLINFSIIHPKLVIRSVYAITFILLLLAVLPSIWQTKFPRLNGVKVDTDPENMLSKDEPVRIFDRNMKKKFLIHNMVIVGIVNEKNPQGVFNKNSLTNIYKLTEFAKGLKWKKGNSDKWEGVIAADIIAPSTVDNIKQGGMGTVRFEWLMESPPKTNKEALQIREKAKKIPFLNGTLLSKDGKAIAIYLPLTTKKLSYKVYSELEKKIKTLKGTDKYFITGLPVAEDTFGFEMFRQMAISGPIAIAAIFFIMWFFFKRLILIISPIIIAIVSIIWTMALLIISGSTIHIMSSVIPVLTMVIAVLGSIHILSEFYDRYQIYKDRKKTLLSVMDTLFIPIFYTSATTIAGFISLLLAPIPPIQVFGVFMAAGIFIAWVLSMTFIPAYIMSIPEKRLKTFGDKSILSKDRQISKMVEDKTIKKQRLGITWMLGKIGDISYHHPVKLWAITFIFLVISIYGMTKIVINDNPVNWFTKSHPIRIADRVLNKHFGGTYMAYLTLIPGKKKQTFAEYHKEFIESLDKFAKEKDIKNTAIFKKIEKKSIDTLSKFSTKKDFLNNLENYIYQLYDNASDEEIDTMEKLLNFISAERQKDQILKQPAVLKYIANLENYLTKSKIVGKANSIVEIVKTVRRELLLGKKKEFKIPNSKAAVAQCLITYQNSHRPQDLWHFVTPDYKNSNIWLQLHSGDNVQVSKVVKLTEDYIKSHPAPYDLKPKWFGLTYINVVWQKKMVIGMFKAFLGSYFVILLMMVILFRSALWSILSMIPLTLTFAFIYGIIGLIGKNYDMPVAMSPMAMGLAIDFAIHFLSRTKRFYAVHKSWSRAYEYLFGEPARAILRNIIVISIGFLPLLAAPLVPYKTFSVFMASILFFAGLTTFFILPSSIKLIEKYMFPEKFHCRLLGNLNACVLLTIAVVLTLAITIQSFGVNVPLVLGISVATMFILSFFCFLLSKKFKCKSDFLTEKEG